MYTLVCSCSLSQFQFSNLSENVVQQFTVTLTAAVLSEVSVEK